VPGATFNDASFRLLLRRAARMVPLFALFALKALSY
jgi:hypothetical protein